MVFLEQRGQALTVYSYPIAISTYILISSFIQRDQAFTCLFPIFFIALTIGLQGICYSKGIKDDCRENSQNLHIENVVSRTSLGK